MRKIKRKPYPLPDSTHGYWRTWCSECEEPIRVKQKHISNAVCNDCAGIPRPISSRELSLTPRQQAGLAKTTGSETMSFTERLVQ